MSELYHHGIKGQKWGVRRYQNQDGSYTDEGRRRRGFGSFEDRRARREQKRNEKLMRKQVKEDRKWAQKNRALLTDAELNARINRLQKEKQFNDLSKQDIAPGKEKTLSLIDKYANQAAGAIVGAAVSGTIGIAISAHTNRELAKKGYHVKGYDENGNTSKGNNGGQQPPKPKPTQLSM